MLVHGIDEGVVVDGTSSNDNDVVTVVVSSLEVGEVVGGELLELVGVSLGRLAELMVTEGVVVGVLEEVTVVVLVVTIVFSGQFLLEQLKLSGVEVGVAHCITKDLNSSPQVSLVDGEGEGRLLTSSFSGELSSHLLDFRVKIGLGSGGSSAHEHASQDVG